MNTAQQLHALQFIVPAVHTIQIGAHTYQVSPITMRGLPRLIQLTEPFVADLLGGDFAPAQIMSLLATHGERVLDAVALCANAERTLIDDMQADQFAALAMLCVEVNADFFSQTLVLLQAKNQSLAPTLMAKIQPGSSAPMPQASAS